MPQDRQVPQDKPTLAIAPCRKLCDWAPTQTSPTQAYGDSALFRCGGCGSEWVASEAWTPRQFDGSVAIAVQEALAQRG